MKRQMKEEERLAMRGAVPGQTGEETRKSPPGSHIEKGGESKFRIGLRRIKKKTLAGET